MAKHVLLNNITHKDLKVVTRYAEKFGDNVNCVLTFPTEFADVQREYPILFMKKPESDEFQSVALLGLAKNENLFLTDAGWNASYVPAMMARGPFLIGFQERNIDGQVEKSSVIHVDLEHPKVSETEGEPVFLPHGGNSPYLERIAEMLRGIQDGLAISQQMFAVFSNMELLEMVNIDIQVNETEHYNLSEYYTINEEKLANLSGEELEKLNKSGFLQCAFLVIASMHNIKKLIDMKNRNRVADRTRATA